MKTLINWIKLKLHAHLWHGPYHRDGVTHRDCLRCGRREVMLIVVAKDTRTNVSRSEVFWSCQ